MRESISAMLPRSIVGRTTLLIILLALLVGAIFTGGAAWMLQHNERERLETRLDELLSTVESTVSIASFVKDDELAREIASGLMSNAAVAGVRIAADGQTLYEETRQSGTGGTLSIARAIRSPFDREEIVGEIVLHASESALHAQAWGYTRYVVYVIALEVLLVAFAVAWVVFNLITRPIKGISDELHQLELRTGMRLRVPRRNAQDEIGRLVGDVNALIARLTRLIDTERTLRLEREASERRLALIFEKVGAGIFEVDRTGMLHSWNPAFAQTLGQPPEPPLLKSLVPAHEQTLQALIEDSLATGQPRETDLELRRQDGLTQWAEISLTPVDTQMLQGVINDITERKRAELAAQQLAARDTLTGLLNRRGLDAGLAAVFDRLQRQPAPPVALLQIDLDRFKAANDTHGHAAGDMVLRRVAEILEGAVRRSDLVARPGGDEFTLVLVGVDGPAKAEEIARTIIEEVGKPIDIGKGTQVQVGASIGIAMVDDAHETAASALARADTAMYAAKQAGRNCARFAPASEPPRRNGTHR